jgi:hypothetical protein
MQNLVDVLQRTGRLQREFDVYQILSIIIVNAENFQVRHRLIKKVIDEQLSYKPDLETRNRKSLEQPAPFAAAWELRCGPGNRFRIFYEVDTQERRVGILAIGVKEGNRLFIGGEEFQL